MPNPKRSNLRLAWPALIFLAASACSEAAPNAERTVAPAERGSPADVGAVEASEAASVRPASCAAEVEEPAIDESVDDPAVEEVDEPAIDEGVEPAMDEGVEPAVDDTVEPVVTPVDAGDVVDTVAPELAGGDVPGADAEPVPALPEEDPTLVHDPGTVDVIDIHENGSSTPIQTNLSPGEVLLADPCTGVTDGSYCATNLGASNDRTEIYYCEAGATRSIGECVAQCDSRINFCDSGNGASGGSVHKADTASPCISCLENACNGEMIACADDPTCSAQWPCLTTCTTEKCETTCSYNFSVTADDGGWRKCADHCASQCN
ncbi:MAG TPA: hypothetical protein VM686_17855 [Polyangiaceae bacterium]|nr:hypothetical protein [Polyangiaceae bacterium]